MTCDTGHMIDMWYSTICLGMEWHL